MNDRNVEQLFSRYLDGVETPEELKKLEELIGTDPRAREELLRMATQDAMVRRTLIEEAAANAWIAGDRSSTPTHGVREVQRPGRSRWRRVLLWGSAAAAAVAVVTLGVWRFVLPAGVVSYDTTGAVVESIGTVNMKGTVLPPKEGDVLRVGDGMIVGEDGLCRFRYADGSVIAVHSNSVFRLIEGVNPSAKAVLLETGVFTADISKQPAGGPMRFKTPHAVATVMGTILRLSVTPESSELSVQTGVVEFAAAGQREMVSSGESATVRDGVLRKSTAKGTTVAKGDVHENERTLFQDSFENGLTNWKLYTRRGSGGNRPTTEEDCPDIHIVRADRDGASISVVELVGRAPDGARVGIVTKPMEARADAYSLSYEYTFDGRPRNAMEGLEIHMGRAFSQKALAPGLWNKVRWECVRKTDAQGKPYLDAWLFFNGELIGRTEYALAGEGIDLVLEVVEGRFRFANVEIREMQSKDGI